MKILFTGGIPDWAETRLREQGHTVIAVAADAYVESAKFCQGIKGIDVYVSGGIESCPASVIDAADRLKLIIFLGVDYKAYIDHEAAATKNITIKNTPGANARAVAEMTILLIMLAARNAAQMLADIVSKQWKGQNGFELEGKTLGLIGAGRIAQHVAQIASGFGMDVLYWTRSGPNPEMQGQYAEFEKLLSDSDIVSLHVPSDSGVVIGVKELAKMSPEAILINSSPARLVDPEALYDALVSGKIARAAFDPFYAEGKAAWDCPEAKLLELGSEKFISTPHSAYRTREADRNMVEMALKFIEAT